MFIALLLALGAGVATLHARNAALSAAQQAAGAAP
jgi:hypothetical protein